MRRLGIRRDFHAGKRGSEHRFDSPRWQATCSSLTRIALLAKRGIEVAGFQTLTQALSLPNATLLQQLAKQRFLGEPTDQSGPVRHGEAKHASLARIGKNRRGEDLSHTNRSYVRKINQIWRYPHAKRETHGGTGARRLLPVSPVHRRNRWDSLPAPSFPSTRANPLNPMEDEGFVQSLESGGKRFCPVGRE